MHPLAVILASLLRCPIPGHAHSRARRAYGNRILDLVIQTTGHPLLAPLHIAAAARFRMILDT